MSIYLPFFETAWLVFQEQLNLFPQGNHHVLRAGDHVAEKDQPDKTVGIITEIYADEIHVVTPRWMTDRNWPSNQWDREGSFEPSQLVRTNGYSVQEMAEAIYGSMGFHHLYDLKHSDFDAWRRTRIRCQHEECDKIAVGVGLLNYWGTIMPFAMCVEHTEYHGTRCEHVPFTGKIQETICK